MVDLVFRNNTPFAFTFQNREDNARRASNIGYGMGVPTGGASRTVSLQPQEGEYGIKKGVKGSLDLYCKEKGVTIGVSYDVASSGKPNCFQAVSSNTRVRTDTSTQRKSGLDVRNPKTELILVISASEEEVANAEEKAKAQATEKERRSERLAVKAAAAEAAREAEREEAALDPITALLEREKKDRAAAEKAAVENEAQEKAAAQLVAEPAHALELLDISRSRTGTLGRTKTSPRIEMAASLFEKAPGSGSTGSATSPRVSPRTMATTTSPQTPAEKVTGVKGFTSGGALSAAEKDDVWPAEFSAEKDKHATRAPMLSKILSVEAVENDVAPPPQSRADKGEAEEDAATSAQARPSAPHELCALRFWGFVLRLERDASHAKDA